MPSADQAHRRLEDLYEISKLFASFEDVEQTFVPAVDIANRTLPLRSAILVEAEAGASKINVWPADAPDSEQMRAVKEHVTAAYAHLVRAPSMPSSAPGGAVNGTSLIFLPLVVADRPPFGA